ncbi:MAG: sulfatase-like hydrolase/transferase [Planctomycetota bacterium]
MTGTRDRRWGARQTRPALLAGLLAAACGGAPAGESRSAVLITLDTVRADAVACYGGPAGLTPSLDALAREGVLYERAHTVAPLTLPSHASMLTGLYPPRHTLRTNGESRLPDSALTVAEAARAAGIQTAAIIGAVVLDDAFGVDQGFDHFDAPRRRLESSTTAYADRRHGEVVAAARSWLAARDRDRPFFLWVHVWDAHPPSDPDPLFAARAPGTPYLGDVAQADHAVGQVLEALRAEGALAGTFLAVAGDHGEAFLEHGEVSHGAYCYEPTLRVPFLLRYSDGFRAGERSREVVSVVDLGPTLRAALGLPAGAELDGQSLYRTALPADRGVYFESYYGWLVYDWSPVAGWIDDRGKYLHSSIPELYDVQADPGEADDLANARPAEVERYRRAIAEVAARPPLPGAAGAALDEEQRARIAALGYGGRGPRALALPHPLADTGLPAPTQTAAELQEVIAATDLLNAGRPAEAEARHRAILQANPDNFYSLEFLATLLMQRRDFAAAAPLLERVMQSDRGSASAALNLGICRRAAGDDERAVFWFEAALEIDANNVRAIRQLQDVWIKRGDATRAAFWAKRYAELTGR